MPLSAYQWIQHGDKIFDAANGARFPFLHNGRSQRTRIPDFAVFAKDAQQSRFVRMVNDISGGAFFGSVHAHVQLRFEAVGKTPRSFVQLVRRYAQICQDTVNFRCAVQAQKAFQIPEIGFYKSEARIIGRIGRRVFVLVKTNQATFVAQLL